MHVQNRLGVRDASVGDIPTLFRQDSIEYAIPRELRVWQPRCVRDPTLI